MKKLILLAVLFSSLASAAQERSYTYIAQRNEWLAGAFRALGLPAGDGPAAFQSGQRPWAGAVYYDSAGVDAGLYIYDGSAWSAVGSGSTIIAGEGLAQSNDSLHLGGTIAAPSYLQNERVVSTNRKIMHWTNGVLPTSGGPSFLPSFPLNVNWSPFQFISSDTVTANDLAVPSAAVPFAGVYASRQIYYADGIIRNQKMFGHNFQLQWNWKDTFSLDTRGGDYNIPFKIESMYLPRGTGRQGVRAAHGTGQTNSRYYAAPSLLVNTFLNNSAGNYIKVNGHLSGVNSYIVMGNVNSDTVGRFIYYTTGGFIPAGSNIGISYDFAPASYFASPIIDSAYGWFDTARVKRWYHANKTVIGPSVGTANPWSSSDQLKVLGNVNITDSLNVGGMLSWNDSTNIDVVLSPRTAGGHALRKIRFDQLATLLGSSGTPTLAQVTNAGNSTTDEVLLNTTDQGAYNLQVGGDIWASNGRLTSPGSFFNIAAVDSLGFSTNGTQKAVIYNDGSIRGKSYGIGGITGTPAYDIQVDANGKFIETAIGGAPALTQYRLAIGDASNLLSTNAAITGGRALVSDANGVPVAATTTTAQVNYLSNVTSDVQAQIDANKTGGSGQMYYFNEFQNSISDRNDGDGLISTLVGAGAVSTFTTTPAANRPGIARLSTGTTTTGRVIIGSGTATTILGAGAYTYETALNVPVLSDGTDRYTFIAGVYDVNSAANQTDGVYFLYDEGGISTGSAASANWQIVTSSNSARTFTTTSVAVNTAAYQTLSFAVNAAGTSVEFFIDGASVGTHTTNIPTGTARVANCGYFLLKALGTTSRSVDADYLKIRYIFTTPR